MSYGENSHGKFSAIKVFDEMSLKDVVTWNTLVSGNCMCL